MLCLSHTTQKQYCIYSNTLAHRLARRLLVTSANTIMEQTSSNQAWGGSLTKYKVGSSSSLGGLSTNVAVYLPPAAVGDKGSKVPVLYYLAGLTCNEDTGAQKGGFLRDASAHGIALVFPDTSPRGAGISGEEADWVRGALVELYPRSSS